MTASNDAKPPARKRKKRRWIKYTLIAPFIIILLYVVYDGFWAMDFANTHGCRIDEAGTYPCVVDGKDWGAILARKTGLVTLLSFMAPIVVIPFFLLAIFILKDLITYIITKLKRKP